MDYRKDVDYKEKADRIGRDVGADKFDIAEGLYWFAADHHDGQWSPLYAILSESRFRPSILSNGPDGDAAKMVYEGLCAAAGCTHD